MKKPLYNLEERQLIYENTLSGSSMLFRFYVLKIFKSFILFFEPLCLPIINFLVKILKK